MNLNKLMKEAQKAQQKMMKVQEEAATITAEAQSGGGMVKAVASAEGKVLQLTIEKEVVDPNEVEMLQDLVVAAVNEALLKSKEEMDSKVQDEMKKLTGGMGLPGMGF